MDVQERNDKAKQYILDQFTSASLLNESDFEKLANFESIKNILTDLIYVDAKGFRGIVATALTGRYLDSNYDFLNNFYACSPRSIFEHGIFYAFEEVRIPCGKSDPLNVAKNINVLDENWAKGKRPAKAALAAVKFLRLVDSEPDIEIRNQIVNYFFFMLLSYAKELGAIKIVVPQANINTNQLIAEKLSRFVREYPESGTTPQLVVSMVINYVFQSSEIQVMGGDESVFGTNTTSKKPADIWLVDKDHSVTNLYEVTVKRIDFKRLDDCIQSLASTNNLEKTVIFICRIPEDIITLDGFQDGSLTYNGKVFNFIDISYFIKSCISLITESQIEMLINEIADFVNMYDRPIKTKNGWTLIFGE